METQNLSSQMQELQNIQKSFKLFSQKTQSLSKLKISFFERMKSAEDEENIEEAHQYFSHLIRTTHLSERIYEKIETELSQYENYLTTISMEEELSSQKSIINVHFNLLLSTIISFLNELKTTIQTLQYKNHSITKLKQIIHQEKTLLERIDHQPDTFFTELHIQKELHELYLQESNISNVVISTIKELEKKTTSYAQKIKSSVQQLNASLTISIKQINQRPLQTIVAPFETVGKKLEKNASIFAATIFGLSIVSNISALVGVGAVAIVCKDLILLMAEIGEPLQAIPSIKKGYGNFKQMIENSVSKALQSIQAT